nr:MAG TPA: Tumor necrosis factor receptor superfamily, TWEAK, TNF Receptor, CRD [Caudoviricetes sp.]
MIYILSSCPAGRSWSGLLPSYCLYCTTHCAVCK